MSGVGNAFYGDCAGAAQGMTIGMTPGGNTTANSVITVPFDTVQEEVPSGASIFTFTDANDDITVAEDGLYGVAYNIYHKTGALGGGSPSLTFATIRTRSYIEVDTGGGFAQPANNSIVQLDNVLVMNNQQHYQCQTCIVELSVGDKVRLAHGRQTGSISNTILGGQTKLHIWKIK